MKQHTERARIADVAREAGVSKTAVSFAFNSPDRLAPETAERIREVAETLGYRPHPVARMLTQRQTLSIGVLTPQALSVIFSNPFFGAFSGRRRGRRRGVRLRAARSSSPLDGSLARAMGRATVDGVVAIGLTDDHPEVEQIRRAGLPIVFVDSDRPARATTRSMSTMSVERALPPSTWSALGHRDFLVIGVEPRSGDRDGSPERRPRPSAAWLSRSARLRSASNCRPSGSSSGRRASRAARRPSTGRGRTACGRPRSSR